MVTRRRLVAAAVLLPLARTALAQTCGQVTARQTEGPFFKPSSPQRVTLIEPGTKAPRLVVSGRVLARDCQPLKGALLDFWHADEQGDYDNRAFRYRGHQFTDADGRWRLETILPAV
jgi:protocatechuate 3,4-dioxygenase beta subunit